MGIFDEALKKQEVLQTRQERKKSLGGGGSFDFEDIKKMYLQFGKEPRHEKVFRILGNPIEMRKTGFDPKLIFFSRIVKDGQKGYINVIWKTKINDLGIPELDEDWILFKLYKKVMESDWRNYTKEEKSERKDDKRGCYEPRHTATLSYARVFNNKKEEEKYPPSFYPKQRVLMNVIDRMDDWCVENKHSKVLFASASPFEFEKDGSSKIIEYVNDIGVPQLLYRLIFENVVKYKQNWDIDIVAKATGQINNAYIVRDMTEKKLEELSLKVGKDSPLTEDELKYGLFNLDELYKETSYTKLYKNIIGLFKKFDADFNENYTEKLTDLVDEETKQRQALKEKDEDSKDNSNQESDREQAVVSERQPRKEAEINNVNLEENLKKIFPFWEKIDDEDRKDILQEAVEVKDGVVIWKASAKLSLCDNKECCFIGTTERTKLPGTVLMCPVCGLKFES